MSIYFTDVYLKKKDFIFICIVIDLYLSLKLLNENFSFKKYKIQIFFHILFYRFRLKSKKSCVYLDFFSSIVPIKSCSGMHSVR